MNLPEHAAAGLFPLSIWTSLYWDLSPEDAVRHIADQGWSAIDLSCEHLGELWRSGGQRQDDWRALAEDLSVTPHQCHLFMDLNLATPDPDELDLKLTAIYWNPHDPLVTINDENYRVGDKVNGFTILEIRKTEIVFRSPAGEKIVKYFYDYLN